jgi:hypothetical protein
MREVEEVVYQRMIADDGEGGLLDLLGTDIEPEEGPIDTSRILHAFQVATPPAPGITFSTFASPKGSVPRQTREVFIAFHIFSPRYSDIGFRLMRLFDGVQHDLSGFSGGTVQIGGVSSVFDFEGPDQFDESLEMQTKDLRFRFFTVLKAQAPI